MSFNRRVPPCGSSADWCFADFLPNLRNTSLPPASHHLNSLFLYFSLMHTWVPLQHLTIPDSARVRCTWRAQHLIPPKCRSLLQLLCEDSIIKIFQCIETSSFVRKLFLAFLFLYELWRTCEAFGICPEAVIQARHGKFAWKLCLRPLLRWDELGGLEGFLQRKEVLWWCRIEVE